MLITSKAYAGGLTALLLPLRDLNGDAHFGSLDDVVWILTMAHYQTGKGVIGNGNPNYSTYSV